jgi:hypothetical protein
VRRNTSKLIILISTPILHSVLFLFTLTLRQGIPDSCLGSSRLFGGGGLAHRRPSLHLGCPSLILVTNSIVPLPQLSVLCLPRVSIIDIVSIMLVFLWDVPFVLIYLFAVPRLGSRHLTLIFRWLTLLWLNLLSLGSVRRISSSSRPTPRRRQIGRSLHPDWLFLGYLPSRGGSWLLLSQITSSQICFLASFDGLRSHIDITQIALAQLGCIWS